MEQIRNKKKGILKRALTSGSLNVKGLSPGHGHDKTLSPSPTLSNEFKNDPNEEERLDYPDTSTDECDDDDDAICILLDSADEDDDDGEGLSGLHINLKTLQAVSSMLAHYVPIIQSDIYGNPRFVAPPPPPEEDYTNEKRKGIKKTTGVTPSITVKKVSQSDDYDYAMQELEDVLLAPDSCDLSDAMTELTDVMEKISRFTEDINEEE